MKNPLISGQELFILFLITLVTLLLRGYKYRITFMLPYSYQYLDPTLFTRDIAFFPYDLNFFFLMNAYLSKIVSYETLFFVGYLISSFLLILGVYFLAKTIFEDQKIAMLAVLLVIFVKPAVSAMTTVWTYYYYKDVAMGLILISVAFFLRKRYMVSFSILGVASLFHILFSLYFVAFYGIYFMWNYFGMVREQRKKMLFGFVVLGLFLVGPIYLILSSEQPQSSPEEFEQWLGILKTRSFDHFFPSTWVTNSVILFFPLLVLFGLFLYYLWTKKDFVAAQFKREITLFFGVVIGLGIIAIVASEMIPIRMLIITQLFRPTIMLTFFALLFSSYLIVRAVGRYSQEKDVGEGLLCGGLFVALFYYDFKLLYLFMPLLLLYLLEEKWIRLLGEKGYSWLNKIIFIITGAILLLCVYSFINPSFLYFSTFGEQIFRLHTLSYVLLDIVGLGIGAMTLFRRGDEITQNGVIAAVIILVLIAGGVNAVHESTIHSDDPCYVPEDDFDWQEHFQYPTYSPTAFNDVARWAGENSPKDALFLVPVECGDFRNVAKRSIFVDFKYGTMSTFSIDFGLEWFERVHALNLERKAYYYNTFYTDFIADYHNLSEERIRELDIIYDLDYAVFKRGKKLSFPVVYENQEYIVYDLQGNNSFMNSTNNQTSNS